MKTISILFLLMVLPVFSQEIKITGVVLDKSKEPIPNILIVVLSFDKTTLSYQYTNSEGEFNFSLNDISAPVFLKTSSLFYEENKIEIDLNKNEKIIFILKTKTTELDEIVITSKRNNDTINLGIQKYNITKTESIEKTLKKIPGISIDKDGRIKYWNKEIEKILIDGDDLAGDQYTFLSKNLRSEILDDIQILKNFEENTVFKKTRKSDKIALNLKINKKFKNIWFGNVSMGYGKGFNSDSEFRGSTNIGLLKKKIKFLNSQNFSTLGDKSIPVFFSDSDFEKDNNPIYSIRKINVPLADELTNFNNAFGNTFLVNKKFNNTILRSTNFIGVDNQKQESLRRTYFFFQGDSLVEKNNNSDKKVLLFGELELKQIGLENNFFINKLKYRIGTNKSSSFSVFDTNEISDFNKNKEISFYDHFQHTYLFKNGIVLNNEVNFGLSNLNENTTINSEDLNLFFQNNFSINQKVDKSIRYFGAKTDVTYFLNRKLKSNLLFNFKKSKEHFDVSLTPKGTIGKNNIIFKRNEFILEPSLIYKVSRKIKLKGKVSSNFFSLNEKKETLLNYDLSLNLKFWGNLEVSYSKKQDFPVNKNFIQNYYLTNTNTFKRGGLFFTPLDYEQIKFKLINNNKTNTFNNEFSFIYKKSKAALLEDYSLSNNINFINTFLISRKSEDFVFSNQLIFLVNTLGFKIETIQSYALIPLSNQDMELTKLYNGLYNFEITSYFSSALNFSLKFEYNNNVQTFDGSISSFDTKNVILNFDWNVNKEISFNINGGVYELDKNYYNIFNASINYIPENSKFSYSLRMNNLLNENEFLYQQRNSFFTSITAIPLVPFYAFGNVKYIF